MCNNNLCGILQSCFLWLMQSEKCGTMQFMICIWVLFIVALHFRTKSSVFTLCSKLFVKCQALTFGICIKDAMWFFCIHRVSVSLPDRSRVYGQWDLCLKLLTNRGKDVMVGGALRFQAASCLTFMLYHVNVC